MGPCRRRCCEGLDSTAARCAANRIARSIAPPKRPDASSVGSVLLPGRWPLEGLPGAWFARSVEERPLAWIPLLMRGVKRRGRVVERRPCALSNEMAKRIKASELPEFDSARYLDSEKSIASY